MDQRSLVIIISREILSDNPSDAILVHLAVQQYCEQYSFFEFMLQRVQKRPGIFLKAEPINLPQFPIEEDGQYFSYLSAVFAHPWAVEVWHPPYRYSRS